MIYTLITYIIDWLFPSSYEVTYLESLGAQEFLEQAKPALDLTPHIYSLFMYKDPLVEKALWELKYRGNRKIAELFATLLYDVIVQEIADASLFSDFTHPIIIPLPLSKERLKERGWNQSEMIVRALKKYGVTHSELFTINCDVLIKIKHTQAQTKLSRKKRMKNLKGCFAIKNPELIKHKNIILIDDVTTTGSTIEEAKNTLLKAGAKNVLAFTIAH